MNSTLFSRLTAATLALAMSVTLFAGCSEKNEARIIKAIDCSGTATYARDGNTKDVYINMNFEPGDSVITAQDSTLDMKLDEDKFVHMFPNSEIIMDYSGGKSDGKTLITLKEGEIYNDIQSKLTDAEKYEVRTSNATIGVRGTRFYVKATKETDIVCCMKGELLLENKGGEMSINAGEAVMTDGETFTQVDIEDLTDEMEFIEGDLPAKTPASSEDEEIPDFVTKWSSPEIEQSVRDYIGKPTGDIMASELDAITSFSVIGNDFILFNDDNSTPVAIIPSENGYSFVFEDGTVKEYKRGKLTTPIDAVNFRCLTSLKIIYNELEDLTPLSDMTTLTSLSLGMNYISDINALSGLTNIKQLSLSDNNISNISSLSGMKKTEKLFLNGNNISDLSALNGMTDMSYLAVSNNSISDFTPLSGMTKLTCLQMGNNSVNSLTFVSEMKQLTLLEMNNVGIVDVEPLYSLTKLETLYIYQNNLTSAQLTELYTKLPQCEIAAE